MKKQLEIEAYEIVDSSPSTETLEGRQLIDKLWEKDLKIF